LLRLKEQIRGDLCLCQQDVHPSCNQVDSISAQSHPLPSAKRSVPG
jgi:hypothetical protein